MKKSKKFKILYIITFVIILLFVTDLTVNASETTINTQKEQYTDEELAKIEEMSKDIFYCYDKETNTTSVIDLTELQQRISNQTKTSLSYYEARGIETENKFSSMMNRSGYQFFMVPDVFDYPYKCTAKIKALKADGTLGKGTGFLVAPNLLLTAAHCVLEEYSSTQFTNWRCIPRYDTTFADSTDSHYQKTGWQRIIYPSNYINLPSGWAEEYDWCLCVLEEPLGNTFSWLPCISYGSDSSLDNLAVTALGYPDIYGSFGGKQQYYSLGSLYDIGSKDFYSNAKTYHGMSGGPILNTSNNYVVGLTKGEEQDDADITYGIRITSSIIDLINENAEY